MNESNPNQKLLPATDSAVTGKPIQRWSAARKREVVLRLLRGESLDAVSREIGVEPYRLEQWRDRALSGLDAVLKERQDEDPVQVGLDAAYKRVGELSMENELLREKIARLEGGVPFRRARSRR
ncbi:transposase [Azospirillum canadense]|uniref:transposase n=1 Tax=Azospirillum canadense TaxID=403962 RepID=UPI0022260897|nr:transposase [Azospirillum canadense]MCW2241798.1 transposase-like protein [Azospirillum canadense]